MNGVPLGRTATTICLVLLLGCHHSSGPTDWRGIVARGARATAVRSPATDTARLRLWAFADSLLLSRAELIRKLGRPDEVSGDTIRNQFDASVLDSIVRLRFGSLEVRYYVRRDGVALLSHLSLLAPSSHLPVPVGPGQDSGELLRHLGRPEGQQRDGGATVLVFRVPDQKSNVFNVVVAHGKVVSLSWVLPLD